MTLLSRGVSWFSEAMPAAAGRAVYFVRGSLDAQGPITGWLSNQEYTVIDESGYSTVLRMDDWSFVTDELPYAVQRGDRIRETLSGTVIEYEILPLADKPLSEWLDTAGVMTVVHSKRVK